MRTPLQRRTSAFAPGAFLALILCASCTTQPLRPIPDPLPETLEWAERGPRGQSFLGLKTRENTSDTLEELSFEPGVYVRSVIENSPAEAAGFQIGDVVLALGGHAVDDPETLTRLVEAAAPRDEVRLKVLRGDSVFEVPVMLGKGAESGAAAERLYRKDPARSLAGWKGGRGGVVLVSSDEDGPFPRAGVPVGSVVYRVEGEDVLSARALIRKLGGYEPGTRVEVEYSDGASSKESAGPFEKARVKLHAEDRRVTGFSVPILTNYSRDLERDQVSFALADLWFISLFRYEREGEEQRYSFLRFFRFSSGAGKLSE